MSATEQITEQPTWYAQDPGSRPHRTLGRSRPRARRRRAAQRRLAEYGPNQLATEPPPSLWAVALGQLSNPMNIMLVIVAVASLAIGQVATGIFVALLVTFNVVMGSRQELKARASVDALAQLQVPHARVRRAGRVEVVESVDLVPGDIVLLEAGDVVPADGRILGVGDARGAGGRAHRRERAGREGRHDPPRGRCRARRPHEHGLPEHAGHERDGELRRDRQPVRRPRWAASPTWSAATQRVRSPLQRELDGMTKIFGLLAWTAVAIIAIVGIARGQDTETLILLCISTAISAIPVGLPTFVQTMLSSGARHLAESKAVVKSLTDVETLGGTTVINSDKTGTLTMNAMTATTMLADGQWFRIEGGGYTKTGAILGVGGRTGARLLAPRPRVGALV